MRLHESELCEYCFQTTEFCGKVEANTLAKLVDVFVECSVGKATGAAILHIRTRKVRDGYANKVRADEDLIKSGEF